MGFGESINHSKLCCIAGILDGSLNPTYILRYITVILDGPLIPLKEVGTFTNLHSAKLHFLRSWIVVGFVENQIATPPFLIDRVPGTAEIGGFH